MMLLSSHISPHSYYYQITNEYLGIFMILLLLCVMLLISHRNYLSYLVLHIFNFPDEQKKKTAVRQQDDQQDLFTQVANSVVLAGVLALTVLIYLKPYGESLYNTAALRKILPDIYKTDNYLIWLALLVIFLILSGMRNLIIMTSARVLKGMYLMTWNRNARNVAYLLSFFSLILCLCYILGYLSISTFTYLAIFTLAIILIFRVLVSVAASTKLNFVSKLNFFIYLCTLEILPILLGLKFLSNRLG